MQNKITDLELKLKLSEQKIFGPLKEGKNSCFEIIQKENTKDANNVIIELNKAKNENQNLLERFKEQKKNFENISKDKTNILNKLNEYNKDKKKLEILLDKKEEDINERNNKGNKLKKDINAQSNENIKIKQNINIVRIKFKHLMKEKHDLEDIMIKQENKINRLNKSINEVKKVIDIKEKEISKDKIYINNLKGVIKDLKNEFECKSIKKINKNNKSKEFLKVKTQFDNLKSKAHNIININNINNINNKNYIYNNPINNLYKINIGRNKKYNNKIIIKYRNKKNNNSLFNRNNSKNSLFHSKNSLKYFEKYNTKNNISLPNVEKIEKKKKDLQIKIKDSKIKLFINKKKYIDLLEDQKIYDSDNGKNIKLRILKKHQDISRKEAYEKEKIEEVKGLFDKIINDFE